MSMWRIRLTLPGGPGSQAVLDQALAGQPVSQVQLTPRGAGAAEMTGEVVLDLKQDDGLGALLSQLHTISPQVFVSRADQPAAPSNQPETAVSRRARRGRPLSPLRARPTAQNLH
jgi:hypothetical protein